MASRGLIREVALILSGAKGTPSVVVAKRLRAMADARIRVGGHSQGSRNARLRGLREAGQIEIGNPF